MAENAGRIEWDLDLDDAKFKSKLKGSHTAAQSFGSKIGGVFAGVGKAALKLGAVASAAFVGFSVLSVKAAAESQAALSQLNAVIKSTGGIAGVTSKAAIDLSKSLQKVTTFSDESVLEAENLLLTFTKIGKKIFPQATKTVLDMSIALGQDTKSSAIQLGKALQDPILGITALRRVGVNFSDKQKEVIQKLVDTGQSLKAQKLILKELKVEFGGSAEAASKTFGGALKQRQNSLNDLQETFGLVIINAITPFVKAIANWATSKAGEDAIQALINGFNNFIATVNKLITIVLPPLKQAWEFLSPPLQQLWTDLQPLLKSLETLYQDIKPLLKTIGTGIALGLVGAFYLLIKATDKVVVAVTKFTDWAHNNKGLLKEIGVTILPAIATVMGVMAIRSAALGAKTLLTGLASFGAASWVAVAPWLALAAVATEIAALWKIMDVVSKKFTGAGIGAQLLAVLEGYRMMFHRLHVPGFASGVQNFS